MRRFTSIAGALAICLASAAALSGCTADGTSTGSVVVAVTKANVKIQSGLEASCPKLEAAHSAFQIASLFFTMPAKAVAIEKAAYATAEAFCADPATVTVATAPAKVLDAIETIHAAKDNPT